MAMDWAGTDQPFAELPEPLTLLAVEGRWGDPATGRVAAHSPPLVRAVVLSPLRRFSGAGMELGQGTHGGALEQRIHQSVSQCLQAVAASGNRRRLQIRSGQPGVGCQRADATALLLLPCLQLQREHHIGQLALAVGAIALIALFPVGIFPLDLSEVLGTRRDGYHAGVRTVLHQGQERLGEGLVPKVIHPELKLMALNGGAARRRHHPGIVNEQVEMVVAIANAFGSPSHAAQVGQVKLKQLQSDEPLIVKLLQC